MTIKDATFFNASHPPIPLDDNDVGILTDSSIDAKRPSLYKVLLLNDDYTPMDFVILILEKFFSKTRSEATEIMLSVHNRGAGVCGIYPFEIAETKGSLVMDFSRENQYPLQCTMEKA